MFYFVTVVLFITNLGLLITAQEFPTSKIERCQAGDTTCLASTITKVLQEHYDGIPELHLPSWHPLHFHNIFLSQGGDSPVTMDMSMAEGDITGWRHMTVTNVVGFDKDPKTSKFELSLMVPHDEILGKYEINGKLLLVPLQGQGDLNITHNGLRMDVKIKTKVITKNNEDYLQIRKIDLDLFCENSHYLLGNLFNSKEISDGLNAALNADSKLVFDSTKMAFARARAGIMKRFITPFFENVPYRMWFAE